MSKFMLNHRFCQRLAGVLLLALWVCRVPATFGETARSPRKTPTEKFVSPTALAVSPDSREIYVASATSGQVFVLDSQTCQVLRAYSLPDSPSGLALSAEGRTLYVTCAAPESHLCVINLSSRKIVRSIAVGHTALSPTPAPDGKTVYVCYRFNNCVGVVDVEKGRETARIAVEREPVAAAMTPDGKLLLVANHLHAGQSDAPVVAAKVSVISTATGKVVKDLPLPNGSGQLQDVCLSPDGRYAGVTHVLARYHLPTTQLERGWMNSNALTLIDLATLNLINTVLLDDVDNGAANPWAACWSVNGQTLLVTHAGTHELSVVDFPGLLDKLIRLPGAAELNSRTYYQGVSRVKADVPNDLSFLTGLRTRVKLAGQGPRAVVLAGARAWVANYFSESLNVVDLAKSPLAATEVALGPKRLVATLRRGEMLFNDASICFQGWQSCASCHSEDARVDGLNWDLLNDGIGNPKNSKSLLLSHQTPPAMSMSVRDTAETAVRAGLRHILFTEQPEEVPSAIDEWLKSLQPIPSPWLVNGKLSPAAKRGQRLFNSAETRCAVCHKPGLFTDLKPHDVGTRGASDRPEDIFDTPTLIEIWRTAPYLHDGSAPTLQELLTSRNLRDQHGQTSRLSKEVIEDLTAYLLSL